MYRFVAKHAFALMFVLVALGSIAVALIFLDRGQKRVQHLYEPKLIMMRVDEVPFPKKGKVPVTVTAGVPTKLTCEVVSPPSEMGRPAYRFHVGGKVYDETKCHLEVVVPGALDTTQTVGIEYLLRDPSGETRVIDHWNALVRPMPGGEHLRIRALETADRHPLPNLTIPRAVIPFVEAGVKLNGDTKKYVVLFFVADLGSDFPILQASAHRRSEEQFEVIGAELKRHRQWGPGIGGYAAWPEEPIQVGSPLDERKTFEIYAGIFEQEKVSSLVSEMLRFEGFTGDGQTRVKALPKSLADIKKLAWKGWMSAPLRVVRTKETQPSQVE